MQLHTAAAVLPIAGPPIREGGVLVADGRIAAVGPAPELASDADTTVEHAGYLMPGLVNAHGHLQYGPAFADLARAAIPFPEWLLEMMARREATADDGWHREVAGSWELAAAAGTVAIADIVTSPAALDIRVPGVRYIESVALESEAWPVEHERLAALLAAHPEAGLSPHTLYTLGTVVFTGMIELARHTGRRLHPHLAETLDEDQFVRDGAGPFSAWSFAKELRDVGGAKCSPAQYLDALGGLGHDVHVAHGTHLDATDRGLLRDRGTAVALCARSNAILGAGVPPVAALLHEGCLISVGTDSLASTPDLDLLNEVRALARIAGEQGYTAPDLAARLLAAATAGGAYAIGRADLGRLAPGASATFAEVTVDAPHADDPAAEVVRTGRAHVVTDGPAA